MKIATNATIIQIKETETFGRGFTKRELIAQIDLDSKYPQTVVFTAMKDKCEILDDFKKGQEIRITFGINGREWNDRIFISLPIFEIKPA